MERLRQLAEEGAIRPTIALSLPMERAVEVHRIADAGERKGYMIVTMADAQTMPAEKTEADAPPLVLAA